MVAIPTSNVPTARAGTRRGAIGVVSGATSEDVLDPRHLHRTHLWPVNPHRANSLKTFVART